MAEALRARPIPEEGKGADAEHVGPLGLCRQILRRAVQRNKLMPGTSGIVTVAGPSNRLHRILPDAGR